MAGQVTEVEAGQTVELHAEFKYDRMWFDFTNLTAEANARQKQQKQQGFIKRVLEATKSESDSSAIPK